MPRLGIQMIKPSKSLEELWEKCQIVYKGRSYNLATNEFYEYLKAIGCHKNLLNQLKA